MSLEPARLPPRIGRRIVNSFATHVRPLDRARQSACRRDDNSEGGYLLDRRTMHQEVAHRNVHALTKRRNLHRVRRLATLPREPTLRGTSSRRTHRLRPPRNTSLLPKINVERRSHKAATIATVDHTESLTSCQRGRFSGAYSTAGLKPGNPHWVNQDAFLISEYLLSNPAQHCFAVFDGHGELGHLVSRRCSKQLCTYFVDANLNAKLSFEAMQQDLSACDFDVKCSGATCVFVHVNGSKLQISNIGDSRGIIGNIDLRNGNLCATPLTMDHKPDRPDEQRRIVACGGQVSCRQLIVGRGSNGPITLPLGPPRVWYRRHRDHGDTMGLAMSRSFGDSIVHDLGVSCDPETSNHQIVSNDIFLICATDGVWDVIDNNLAVQIVHAHWSSRSSEWSPGEAALSLCMSARHRWESLSPVIDDITALVIDLQKVSRFE